MQDWLPTTTKAKLVRQVLVQKERGLFRCHATCENGGLSMRDHLPILLKPEILIWIGS